MSSPGRTVLLVDDEEDLRVVLDLALRSAGLATVMADSGKAALSVLHSATPDLVLLDLSLPDMNGLLLLDIIHGHEEMRHVPVICLTGERHPPVKIQAFARGAVDYVTKPFRSDELIARIRAHLTLKDELEEKRREAAEQAESALLARKRAEQRLNALVQNSFDLVCELDQELHLLYGSPNHQLILGYTPEEMIGVPWLKFLHPDDMVECRESLELAMQTGASVRVLARFRDVKEQWRWLDISGSQLATPDHPPSLLLVSRDITHDKESEARLRYMVLHDSLTGVGNRQMFNQELNNLLRHQRAAGRDGVIFLDIDNFKVINDTKGHPAGDRLLRAMGTMLSNKFGAQAIVCRVGGDEFCILLRNITAPEAVAECERLLAQVQEHPAVLDESSVGITLSAGIAMVESGITSEELLSRADSALSAAKASGKNRCYLYRSDSEELADIRGSAAWYHRIQEGLEEGRFKLLYQPILSIRNGSVRCWEALLRYEDEKGLHAPGVFLPAAERYQFMSRLDRFVIRHVLEEMAIHGYPSVAVNLSGQSVTESGMQQFILERFQETGVDPARVTFEITETIFISNMSAARALVGGLRELGCTVSLDDFGSGFSSLNYLRNLPVDIVKIDGSFVDRICENEVDRALFRSINEIVHMLGKLTVAEYVDSPEKVALLREFGVDFGQGFFLGKPAPVPAVPELREILSESSGVFLKGGAQRENARRGAGDRATFPSAEKGFTNPRG